MKKKDLKKQIKNKENYFKILNMKQISLAHALAFMFAGSQRRSQKQPEAPKPKINELKTYFFDNYGKMQEKMNEYTIFKCEAENNRKAKLKFKDWKRKNFSK